MTTHDPTQQTITQLVHLTGKSYATIKKRLITLPPLQVTTKEIFYNSKDALPLIYGVDIADSDKINFNVEKARSELNRADKLEMENRVRRGELVERSEVLTLLQKSFGAVRAKLLSIPTKSAPVIVTLGEATLVQSTLKKFINDALDELTYPGFKDDTEGDK